MARTPPGSIRNQKKRHRAEETGDDLPSSSGNDNVTELQAQVQELEGEMARERAAKKEWEAAAEGLSGLHTEVERLEGELGKAQERRIEAEQQQIACSREKTTLMTDLVELRKKLAAKEEELAAKEGQIEGSKKEIKRLLSLVKAAEEERDESKEAQANAEGALSEAAVAGSRRSQDETRFHYILAGTGQVGSIPRSYLDSVPESLLTKMYNGEWDYCRDEWGRALINCHPD
jgi:chromosome segregation ATPase